jgi:hypothetical protein
MNKNILLNKMLKTVKAKPFYRVILHSADGEGINSDKWFQIQCPHIDTIDPSKKYQFALEKFINTNQVFIPMYINIPSLTQINSFDSSTQSATTNVSMIFGENVNNTIQFDTIGIPLCDINWLINNRINITITNMDLIPIDDLNAWSMSLLIWEIRDVDNK